MEEKSQKPSKTGKITRIIFKFGSYSSLAILGILLIAKAINSISELGKYKGLTAEEWHFEYANALDICRNLYNCVEYHVDTEEYSALEDIKYQCL